MFMPKSRTARNQQIKTAQQNLQKRFRDALKISAAQPTQSSDQFFETATTNAASLAGTSSLGSRQPSSSSRLIALPPELFERIAESCDASSLKSLRLTSRECASRVQRTYTKLFFTDIGVLLCRESSIRAAINILHHPIFGSHVQSIGFYVDIIPHPRWPAMKAVPLETRTATGKFRNEYDNMRHQSSDVRLLRELFGELKKQDRVLPLLIDGDPHLSPNPPLGLGAILDINGVLCQPYDVGPFSLLLAALEKSTYRPSSLSILPTASLPVHDIGPEHPSRLQADPSPFKGAPFKAILHCLKSLNISFWCDFRDQLDAIKFGTLLAEAPNLEELAMHIESYNPDAIYSRPDEEYGRGVFLDIASVLEAVLKTTMPKLHGLALDGPAASFGGLLSFVLRNPGLQELTLKGTKIWCDFNDEKLHSISTDTETVSQVLKRLTKLSVIDVDEEADQWWDDRETWLI